MRVTNVQSTPAFQPYCVIIEVQSNREHHVLRALMQADVLVPGAMHSRIPGFDSSMENTLRGVMQEISRVL